MRARSCQDPGPDLAAPATARLWRLAAMVPLAVQLVVLLSRSSERYDRFNLSLDFGIFHQAWHQIAHGDLSPDISPFGYPYWRSHCEVIMWLLAPLQRLVSSGVVLLWIQDLAVVGAMAVAVWWAGEIIDRRWPGGGARTGVVLVTVGLLGALNPWILLASAQDFHFQAVGTLFTILAARDFWAGRIRRGWVWAVLALSTGDVSGTYVAGLGLGVFLADRRRWRLGLALFGAGAGWVALVTALDAGRGSGVATYAYLIGSPADEGLAGVVQIAWGMASHPGEVVSVLWERKADIARALVPTGVIGHLAPWSAGPVLVVLAANALHENPFFMGPSYQNIPIYIFGLAGTGVVAMSLVTRIKRAQWAVTGVVCAALVVGAVALASGHGLEIYPYRVDRETAADLVSVKRLVPAGAEVISSFGVGGRFADRRHLYLHAAENQTVPVREGTVFFVFAPTAGNQGFALEHVIAVAHSLRDRLGAATVMDGPRVFAYRWEAPPDVTEITLSPSGP